MASLAGFTNSSAGISLVDRNAATYGTSATPLARSTALVGSPLDLTTDKSFDVGILDEPDENVEKSRVASLMMKDDDASSVGGTTSPGGDVGDFFGTQKLDLNDKKLGTFAGVFFPCLANIFGVILFLRQPWILGQSGLIIAEMVVVVSVLATTLTALSMSAIATNGQVKAGGTYFMISRTLGPEFGGAVGVSFYLATAIAIPMYLLGTVETMQEGFGLSLGLGDWDSQVVGLSLSLLALFTVYIGVGYVSKAIPFFLSMTMLGILSIWLGLLSGWAADDYDHVDLVTNMTCSESKDCITSMWEHNELKDNIFPSYEKDYDWRYVFGLFFPSVTGITAGANLSACLKNPSRSIPKGTLGAISFSSVVYVVNIILFAMSIGSERLKDLNTVLASDVAFPHPVVVKVAIVASTLGAALTSFAGAPRLLQALAHDGTLPLLNFLREDPEKEPRKTLLLTWIVAVCGIMVGDLNFVTPICTMFFLTFYAFTNAACLLLIILRSPNFRPDFKSANVYTSGLGVLLCTALMFIINPFAACGSLVLSAFVYVYISVSGHTPDWGDALFDLRWYTTRKSLLQLDKYGPVHCKNWRPNLMILTKISLNYGNPQFEEEELVTFLTHLRHARGLQVLGTVLEHDMTVGMPAFDVVEARESITNMCHRKKMKCFTQVVADSVEHGIASLLQVAGVGRFQPNIVLSGWPCHYAESEKSRLAFMSTLRMCEVLHKALIVLRSGRNEDGIGCGDYPSRPQPGSTIDIWWTPHGGGLLLLIPHLLSRHRNWTSCRLRVFSLVEEGADVDDAQETVNELFKQLRFDCESHVVQFGGGRLHTFQYPRLSVRDVLAAASEQMNTPGNMTALNLASKVPKPFGRRPTELESEGSDPSPGASPHDDVCSDREATERLNEIIREESSAAAVVILNLPKINLRQYNSLPDDSVMRGYMEGIDRLTRGLPPTLLIRDGGRDVTTSFS
eukprot:TRINITY_DN7636_c2_g1_i2.p1 TRINITY_DN7636_c2_g1~~TRINITY_DN7636_c2_g1_i2.p1  ORF type:complete len:963 (+),score=345.35 TRINITY_DN7636_c2_g1_i2:256-3144(+)